MLLQTLPHISVKLSNLSLVRRRQVVTHKLGQTNASAYTHTCENARTRTQSLSAPLCLSFYGFLDEFQRDSTYINNLCGWSSSVGY